MKRPAQIVTGIFVLAVSLALPVGIIFAVGEQPATPVLIGSGVGLFAGLWFTFPVGTGEFGDWLARKVPFLHDHGEDDG